MQALFITFEGLDGSGKSTHLKHAAEWLQEQGVAFETTREPGGTHLGQAIRGIFLDPERGHIDGRVEAMLMFADRRQHLVEMIEPALAAGRHVLCDRFTDSTLAYQGAGRGVDREVLLGIDRLATHHRRPDHTLLFDLPAELAQQRGQSHARRAGAGVDRLDAEGLDFYRRVREGFLALAAAEPRRFTVVDTSGPLEQAWQRTRARLEELLLPDPLLPDAGGS